MVNFEQWKKKVDQAINKEASITSDDLPDFSYYDAWEDGLTPGEAAQEALKEAGWSFGRTP